MSGQGQIEHEETCLNCNDSLIAGANWKLDDVQASLLYCTKETCQASKPVTLTTAAKRGPSPRKLRPYDTGLARQLKPSRRFIKNPPDAARVAEFNKMIEDPEMKDDRGWIKYSRVLRKYGSTSFKTGWEIAEMAVAQFPDEIDVNGCPAIQAIKSLRNYLNRTTKRYNGNLEIHSTRGVKDTEPRLGSRVWRWHINKEEEDVNKQVGDMMAISKNIELAAKKREADFHKKTFEERMEKVTLLDQFFDEK